MAPLDVGTKICSAIACGLSRNSRGYLTVTAKRSRPSTMVVIVSPPTAVAIISCTSPINKP